MTNVMDFADLRFRATQALSLDWHLNVQGLHLAVDFTGAVRMINDNGTELYQAAIELSEFEKMYIVHHYPTYPGMFLSLR